jgi:hypothetical protein
VVVVEREGREEEGEEGASGCFTGILPLWSHLIRIGRWRRRRGIGVIGSFKKTSPSFPPSLPPFLPPSLHSQSIKK